MKKKWLLYICVLSFRCTGDEPPKKEQWSLHGTVFWKGSEQPVANAEVVLYDPFNNQQRFINMTRTSEAGQYSFTDQSHREAIDIDATLDGRQPLVGVTRNGEPVSRRISDLDSDMRIDLHLQGQAVLDLEMTQGSSDFSYGMISGAIDSFFIFSVDLPRHRTMNVLAEHPDSISIILYNAREEVILKRTEHFEIKNNQILPLKLDL